MGDVKMVSRSTVTCTFGILVIIFITIQTYLFYSAPKLHPIQKIRKQSSAFNMIKEFVLHCDKADVHCILVDPYILRKLVEETFEEAHSPCRLLCKNHVYTFAIRSVDFDDLKFGVLPKLRSSGYDIDVTYSERIASEIPTHIHLRAHDNHALHIVIFHQRYQWYWYGSDHNSRHHMEFTNHEGALDEFEYNFKAPIDGIELYLPHYPKKFVYDYEQSVYIPCNISRANTFFQLHPKDTSKNATEFKENALKAINLIKARLDKFGVPFWLSSGTLLGWFRQCDIIPYTVDVDIGVFIKDHGDGLLEKLKASSLGLDHKFGKISDSLQYTFDMGKLKLDIFFFYEDKLTGKVWNGGTDYNSGEKFKYSFDKFTLCWSELEGIKIRVPCDTELYIKANYGPNWFTPVKNWDWKTSPFNVKPNGEWPDDELNEVIQLWDKNGKRLDLDWERQEL